MRPLEADETVVVHRALDAWGSGVADAVVGDRELWIDDDNIVRLVARADLPAEIRAACVGGLPIGALDDGFVLGLQGAVFVTPHATRGRIRAADKGAAAWLYGRPLMAPQVMSYDYGIRPGDACIVTNARHEALGIGTVVGTFKGTREVVEPVHELGAYLRDEDS